MGAFATPLPQYGVLVTTFPSGLGLLTMSLLDGAVVGRATASAGTHIGNVAADCGCGLVFASTHAASNWYVHKWSWNSESGSLRYLGLVVAAGREKHARPLAVMPPTPGKRCSYLIVGTVHKPELRVLSLPGLALVHMHKLEGMGAWGLAADPWGTAIAVSDYGLVPRTSWPGRCRACRGQTVGRQPYLWGPPPWRRFIVELGLGAHVECAVAREAGTVSVG